MTINLWQINRSEVVKMYAIAFDLKIDDLKKAYGEPYNRAYDEIRQEMETLGFNWTQVVCILIALILII